MSCARVVVDEPTRSVTDDRVYTEHRSLDAAFALLDDVRAQSFALQQRLRNSLPVRWSSNALVMQRSAVEQHSEWDAKRRADVISVAAAPRQRPPHKGARRPANEGLHDAADSSARAPLSMDELDWSQQRYRRKVEWDVAKRIARIDRELTTLPPAQRFWNKKRAHEHRQQQLAKELSGTREARVRAHDAVSEKGLPRKKSIEKAIASTAVVPEACRSLSRVTLHGKENSRPHYEKQTMGSRVSRPVERAPSIDSSAKERKPAIQHREKENRPPKQKSAADAVQSSNASLPEPKPCMNSVATSEQLPKATLNQELRLVEEERVMLVENETESKLAHDIFVDLDEPTVFNHSQHDQGELADRQRNARPEHQQQTSSVSRQVLSDFRNAPSMALYGPPAVNGDRHNRKLNSDVLRRLFSDLDSDRDGHLNRIETCMALHRLQIAVPATRIASFFRRVYAEVNNLDTNRRGNSNGSRAALGRQPLKEMINYKQFVAFVTAANETRQGLQQIRPESSRQRLTADERGASRTTISSSRPRAVDSIPPMQFSASMSSPLDRGGIALYELETNEGDRFEQNVLESIPDYLISRLLADEPSRDGSSNKTASVVRKSLERLLPRDSVDDKMVQEIARELVREHLENRISPPLVGTEEDDDSSGLSRAAAYFEKLSRAPADMEEESNGEEREIEDLDSWLDQLTEEQVTALVQEILKEKVPALLLQTGSVAEEEPEELGSPSPLMEADSLEKGKDDKETDTQDFLSTHIQLVAEKETQTGGAEEKLARVVAPDSDPKIQVSSESRSTSSGSRRLPATRTNLAKAAMLASPANPDSKIVAAAQRRLPSTSISVLQQLRAERKQFCKVPPKTESVPATEKPVRAQSRVSEDQRRLTKLVETRKVHCSIDIDAAEVRSKDSDENSRVGALGMNQSVAISDAPPQLIEKTLFPLDISHQNSAAIPSARSSIALSTNLSSSGDSQQSLFSDFATSTSLQMASTIRNRRRKWVSGRASVASSRRNFLASENLSEGEITRRASLDLSDGEIVGRDRERVVMQKNAANRFCGNDDQFESGDELNDTKSSIESGELLPIRKLRSAYRQRVLDLSFSSAESGELEEGLLG